MSKTFTHDFGDGVVCTATAPDEPPDEANFRPTTVTWSKRSDPRNHFKEYMAWMGSVNKQLADGWQRAFYYAFLTPNGPLCYFYSPGRAPIRVSLEMAMAKSTVSKIDHSMPPLPNP